ncbi:helix-turn-helix domain-containing protein [Halanaeroarchaeum sulfurireducens]|uniref:Bacterio-opsin activator HTH domain-containing protein n=1 Tax=Halanaeroarchaeum sulfurireducens TaxID=1604004 RepID=A0A0F7PD02_9EURY|nr:helix-turn-helix domain-containing protein [Halanaeroarchaeum sulfurireducens]AKH97188.1 bacterio-opsin activator HTH domain-containing protein [Halanaeroarchaeum sulfurireducens]
MSQQSVEKSHGIHEREVQVVFEIAPKGPCFLDDMDGEISHVELYFPGGECHSDVTICRNNGSDQDVEVMNYTGDICTNCPGVVFGEHDLVPRYKKRDDDGFVVQVHLPSSNELSDVVSDLRRVSEYVRILRIVDVSDQQVDDVVGEVDYTQLTDKQRVALEGAVTAGYYDLSKEVPLAELAAEFGISTSALSQRLARAEQNVMGQLFRDRG